MVLLLLIAQLLNVVLFDLELDPSEITNISNNHPSIISQMEQSMLKITSDSENNLDDDEQIYSFNEYSLQGNYMVFFIEDIDNEYVVVDLDNNIELARDWVGSVRSDIILNINHKSKEIIIDPILGLFN